MDQEPGEFSHSSVKDRTVDKLPLSERLRSSKLLRRFYTAPQEQKIFDYYAAVEQYLSHREEPPEEPQRVSVDIPTVHGYVHYVNEFIHPPFYITNRSAAEYDEILFSDIYEGVEFTGGREVISRKDSVPLCGGKQGALGGTKVIVDLGTGEAFALLDYSRQFPTSTCIGVDTGYDRSVKLDMARPGVQLTQDSWDVLDTIPDNSVDTILSSCGASTWGLYREGGHLNHDMIQSITRIAKQGAIFRFEKNRGGNQDDDQKIISLLQDNWDIKYAPDTVVAVKK